MRFTKDETLTGGNPVTGSKKMGVFWTIISFSTTWGYGYGLGNNNNDQNSNDYNRDDYDDGYQDG